MTVTVTLPDGAIDKYMQRSETPTSSTLTAGSTSFAPEQRRHTPTRRETGPTSKATKRVGKSESGVDRASRRRPPSQRDQPSGFLVAIADIAAYTHLSDTDIEALGDELDAIRSDVDESLGARDAAYIRRTIVLPTDARCRGTADDRGQPVEAGWLLGDRVPGVREERREHGDRPQRLPRPMGLDERPGDPLQHLGVGHGRASRRNGGIRTTTATTCSATSSESTTISASASCG